MKKLWRLLNKLPKEFDHIEKALDKAKYDTLNFYFQDESRFGLLTRQKRILVSKGVKPIGKFQRYGIVKNVWGVFSPITGEAFYWETPYVSNKIFEGFLEDFSRQNPRKLKILVIDNAGFHALKNIKIP